MGHLHPLYAARGFDPASLLQSSGGRCARISAAIYCERDGQKAILIGKGGAKLKEIGTGARKQIESLLGTRVYLELRVIVEPGWRESRSFIDSLDWRNQLERLAEKQSEDEG
jgi:GTP-binding protein Era